MADKKISQLTAATTPLDGTEVLPIVKGGSTVKVPVSDLTAGRAVSALSATLTGGTANGVLFLNGSKAATSGSALVFDGSKLGIGAGSPDEPLHISGANNRQMLVESTSASGVAVAARYKTATRTWVVGNGPGLGDNTFSIFDETAGVVRLNITATGNTVTGTPGVALATTATNGFLYVPTCAGAPTGTPTAITGFAPIVVDTTNNKLYFYSAGQWRDAGP